MEYHKLAYKKEINEMTSNKIPVRRIVFDGKETDYLIDELALKVSSEKDGIYPIVVCDCDIIGCGGMYVSTRIDGDDIIWGKFWFGQCSGEPDAEDELKEFSLVGNSVRGKNLIVKPPLHFKRKEYEQIADELIEFVRSDTLASSRTDKDWIEKTLKKYREGNTFRI